MIRTKPIPAPKRAAPRERHPSRSKIALGWWTGKTICGWSIIGLLAFAGCDQDRCLLHSDCTSGEICLTGTCVQSCGDDLDCPVDRVCSSGGCVTPDPNARVRCASDAGCTDAGADASDAGDAGGSTDAAPIPDGAEPTPDGAEPADLGSASDGDVGPIPDGLPGDGFVAPDVRPPPIDLSGVFAVRSEVTLTSSREFDVGDEAHTIVTLVFLRGSVYRMEVRDQQGTELFVVAELDFASPDSGTYQFSYPLEAADPPDGCARTDERFQRGRFTGDGPFQLDGDEDLRIVFAGDDCGEDDAMVQQHIEWRPVPRP